MHVGPLLPVVVVEAGDVGAHAVHRGHLECGRGRGQAHGHRLAAIVTAGEQSAEKRRAAGRERRVEHAAERPSIWTIRSRPWAAGPRDRRARAG